METAQSKSSWREYLAACRSMPERDRRNARIANWWLFFWCITFLPALYMLKEGLIPSGALSYAAAIVPTALAAIGVAAYVRFLRDADELQRQIQLEALSLGFGAGFVAAFGLQLLEEAGLGTYGAPDTFSAMLIFYFIGLYLGTRRYA